MNTFSRGTWLALAAVVAVPTTVAIAKNADRMGWQMSPETQSRLEDGRIAMVKTALQLNADQEKLWAPVESQVRDAFKKRQEKRAEWAKKREERRDANAKGAGHERPDLAERYERKSKRASERAERLKAFSEAFKPFYASLSDEQKDVGIWASSPPPTLLGLWWLGSAWRSGRPLRLARRSSWSRRTGHAERQVR
jgi:hypothetical protein